MNPLSDRLKILILPAIVFIHGDLFAQITNFPKEKPNLPVSTDVPNNADLQYESSRPSKEYVDLVPQAKKIATTESLNKKPARQLFGTITDPAPLESRSIGYYSRGCLSGAIALERDGPNWQVMRLSRNRFWGHPELIEFMKELAANSKSIGWNGLLVGDLAQPRGGPMLTGHASHQVGLDADIWLTQMPDRKLTSIEREEKSAISMLKGDMSKPGADRSVDDSIWTDTHAKLIRMAAKDKRVERIFVSPAIKKAICAFAGEDREWLSVVRPWWGHHYHFHVRLKCPPNSTNCASQDPPPPGDGCGKELDWWLSDEPWVPKKDAKPIKKKELTLAGLPRECSGILTAN